MNRRSVLFAIIFSAFAITAFSQSSNTKIVINQLRPTDDVTIVGTTGPRAAAVKASVILNIGSLEREAFDVINQKRAENGLSPLVWSDDLAAVARHHSADMAKNNYFNHRGLDGSMVSDRADRVGISKWRAIGENIAFDRGYRDPVTKAVELWMESAAHRQNLMNQRWKESAIGVALADDGSYYFTQVFLVRK